MAQKGEIHLDILIKREGSYFSAHCLQFDLVATDDTMIGVQKAIIDLCLSHIENSIANDNLEYMFSPAPKEVWAEYFASMAKHECQIKQSSLPTSPTQYHSFHIQEVACA